MKVTHHKNGEIKTLVDEAPYHPGYEDVGFKPVDKPNTNLLDEAKKLADDIREYAPDTNIELMIRNLIKEIERLTIASHYEADFVKIAKLKAKANEQ